MTLISRPPRARPALAGVTLALAALLATSAPRAQAADDGVAAQRTLRDRWRVSFDLGAQLTTSVNVPMSDRFVATNNSQLRLAASVSLWRAVHPALDLGASLGVMGPHGAYTGRRNMLCGQGEEVVEAPFGAPVGTYDTVTGATPYAVAGLRLRPWGAGLPFHLVLQAGVSVRLLSGRANDTVYCGVRDPITREVSNRRAMAFSVDGARVPAFVWSVGVQSHFGDREAWSFGTAVWVHHDGAAPLQDYVSAGPPNLSAVFSLGYSPSFGPALPEAALARGRRVRNLTLGTVGATVGGVVLVSVVLLAIFPP